MLKPLRGKRRQMRVLVPLFAGAVLTMIVTGCTQNAAANAPSRQVASRTASQSVGRQYLRAVGFTLNLSIQNGAALLAQMEANSPSSLARPCVLAGDRFSSTYDTFAHYTAPPALSNASRKAFSGMKQMLSALDECGIAADAADPGLMRTAEHDMWTGLRQVTSAQRAITAWVSRAHS